MSIAEITVFIYLPGETTAVPAGIFRHDSDMHAGTFAYGRKYVERPNAMPVDPVALPLGVTPQPVTTNDGLYGAFRDSSPDYWGRLVIASQQNTAPEALGEIDFLMAPQATRVGDLDFRFSPADTEPALAPPHFSDLADIMIAADSLDQGQPAPHHLLQLLRQGSSVGGARPKRTVLDNDSLWIAKFPSHSDTINIPRTEYAAMTLASRCGIRIPQLRMVSASGKDILLVKRFDRELSGSGWTRQGYISALSLMQLDEHDRLHWSYPSIAALMRRHCTLKDIHELFLRMVFNILVRNTDDHPRNHGFLSTSHGLRIAPAFDIVPSLARKGVNPDSSLAMSVGDRGREATISNALSCCDQFGLSKGSAEKIIAEVSSVAATWRKVFEECGVSEHDIGMLSPSFER